MKRSIGLAILCLTSPVPLAAQTVVKTEPPLDSARLELRDALVTFRDSLLTVNGAAARLQRDVRQASNASLLSRARVMRDACAGSARAVAPTRRSVQTLRFSKSERTKPRKELVSALNQLEGALTRCAADFAAMSRDGEAETVRGYSYKRSGRVQRVMQEYEASLRRFLDAVGIQLPALGAGSHSGAG
jgi:hypothetical protein